MEDKKLGGPVSSQIQEVKSNTGMILFTLFVLFGIIIGGVYYLIATDAFKSERMYGGLNMGKSIQLSSIDSSGKLKLHLIYLNSQRYKIVEDSISADIRISDNSMSYCNFIEFKNLDDNNSTELMYGQAFTLEFDCGGEYEVEKYYQGVFKYNLINPKTGIPRFFNGDFEFKVVE